MKGLRLIFAGMAAGAFLLFAKTGWCAGGASQKFTNRVETFTNLDGGVYDNADIIRADFYADGSGRVVYRTNGDYNSINFSKLSPDTLTVLGVPANYRDLARNAGLQRQQAAERAEDEVAAEEQRLLNPSNLIPVRVDTIISKAAYDPIYGTLYKCQVHLEKYPKELNILVARLPDRIAAYYKKIADQEQAIAGMENQVAEQTTSVQFGFDRLSQRQYEINQERHMLENLMGNVPREYYPASPLRSSVEEGTRVNQEEYTSLTNAQARIASTQKEIDSMKKQLSDLKDGQAAATTLLMLPGRWPFNGIRVFVCAPETVQPQPPDNSSTNQSTAAN